MSHSFNNVNTNKLTLVGFFEKSKEVFSLELGIVKGVKFYLICKTVTVSMFSTAHSVAPVYLQKIDWEINLLITNNILEPVKTSVWADLIVPLPKQDVRIRIYVYFKLTFKINRAEKILLPRIEDLFCEMSRCTTFTKFELRDAYCQLELDHELKYLVW